jgi:hypothetical protein
VNQTAASLNVDAFTVEPNRTTVDDTALSVVYAGSGWTHAAADQGGCGTDVHCTSVAGATVMVTITGSGISWVAPRLTDTGLVRVYVDGIDEGELTPTKGAADPAARQVNYSVTWLVPGVHSLKIVNGGVNRLAVNAFTVLA